MNEDIVPYLKLLGRAKSVVALTGAGISAESGVCTFRGPDGLWEKFDADEVATPEAFERNPKKVWEFHDEIRRAIANGKPNMAHYTLAKMEKYFQNFKVITQNIDEYHQDAGCSEVLELHGNAWRVKCIAENKTWIDKKVPMKQIPPHCECGSLLRPDVVWFNEPLNPRVLGAAVKVSETCELMLVIGTSVFVQPAASLPYIAKKKGAVIFEFNLEPTPLTGIADLSFFGKAGETLPKVWDLFLENNK